MKNEKITKKTECDQVEDEISEEKKALSSVQKDIQAVQKSLMAIECRMESKKADRHAVLLMCKMECIDLPLSSGTLDNIAGGSSQANGTNGRDDDDDDDDEGPTQTSYQNDSQIKPNYSSLSRNLKDVSLILIFLDW